MIKLQIHGTVSSTSSLPPGIAHFQSSIKPYSFTYFPIWYGSTLGSAHIDAGGQIYVSQTIPAGVQMWVDVWIPA